MRNIILTGLILILSYNIIVSQENKNGLILDIAGLYTKTNLLKENNYGLSVGGGFAYSRKLNLKSDYQFEIRTGVFFAESYFEGFQCGLFLRKKISDTYYCLAGINSNINLRPSHGIMEHEEFRMFTFTFGVGIAYKYSENISFLFGINKTIDDYFGSIDSSSKYLLWVFRGGLEYGF